VTDTRKLQAAYDALVVGFLAPLLSGETAELGRPVAPGALDYFSRTRAGSAEAESRVFDRLHRMGSEIAEIQTVPWPSRDLVAIAMVMHDLALLTDPSLDRLFARGARTVILGWIDDLLDRIGPPSTRGDALARHAMLQPFLALERRDTVVRNWAYTYRFYGRVPPANVVALPRVRLVRQEHTKVPIAPLIEKHRIEADLALSPRLRDLVSRSPVTELSRPDAHAPLRFGLASLRVLSDPALRGGIARQIAAGKEWQSASALGEALDALRQAQAPPALVAPALRLIFEVHVTCALDARLERRMPSSLDAGAAWYAAVLPAWLEDPHAIEEIRALDDGDRALLQRRAERLRAVVPRDVQTDTLALVARSRAALFSLAVPLSEAATGIEVSS
jgi:hypothetical protein